MTRSRAHSPSDRWRHYEAEVVGGLEEFATQELEAVLGASVAVSGQTAPGRVSIRFRGDPRRFFALRSIVAAHAVETFEIPRPRALLGHQHLETLVHLVKGVQALHPAGTFATFRVSAAGADSAVFVRLKDHLAEVLGLTHVQRPAHLQVAVRRPPGGSNGWQILVRVTQKPLTARPWRVRDYPSALNASVASVMTSLAGPAHPNRVLNLCCGSGTLMVERLASAPATLVAGIDHSRHALACATDNLRAAGHHDRVHLFQGDVGAVPLGSGSIDEIVVDLPYGMTQAERGEVDRVYTAALSEATRLAAPRASLVAITVRKRLFESALGRLSNEWSRVRTIPVRVPFRSGYINPTIYALRRNG